MMPDQTPDRTNQAVDAISRAIDALVGGAREARIAGGKRAVDAPQTNLDDAAADLTTQMMIDIANAPGRKRNLLPRERGAFIRERGEEFVPTEIARLASPYGGDLSVPNREGLPAAAIVHTHPDEPYGQLGFSDIDQQFARQSGLESFVAQNREGSIISDLLRYSPKTEQTEEVLAQLPTGRIAEFFLNELRRSGLAGDR
jgi:hypothetical protein